MTFNLSARSLGNLSGVHPSLVSIVVRAIEITEQDFGVTAPAVRTAEEQNALFRKGVSQKDGYKNKSNHQPRQDGFGHAVDLTPFINGRFDVNNEAAQYPIAAAMSRASADLGVKIIWGGNWMEPLKGETVADMRASVARYKVQHPGPDFIDLPHFQLA